MSNHDTALVIGLWVLTVIVVAIVMVDDPDNTVNTLADPEMSDDEVDDEFAALTTQPGQPFDYETDGL